MFEHNQSDTSEEEQPRQLRESFINLDTQTGQAENYDNQSSPEQEPMVFEHKDYVIIKPQVDERRMIALPKRNEPVNISEMLSRSFIHEDPQDMNMSMNTENIQLDESMYGTEGVGRNDQMNITTDFSNLNNYTPLKSNRERSTDPFKDRQQKVLEEMEKEHLRISTLKLNTTSD